MASSLEEFLSIEPEEEKIVTVPVKMKNGKVLEVDVKNIDIEQFKRIKKISTDSYNNPNGGATAQIEEITFCQKLCSVGIVAPSLNNVKLRAKYDVHSNEALVGKMFLPRAIVELGMTILNLTLGEDGDIEVSEGTDPAKVEEAKN